MRSSFASPRAASCRKHLPAAESNTIAVAGDAGPTPTRDSTASNHRFGFHDHSLAATKGLSSTVRWRDLQFHGIKDHFLDGLATAPMRDRRRPARSRRVGPVPGGGRSGMGRGLRGNR